MASVSSLLSLAMTGLLADDVTIVFLSRIPREIIFITFLATAVLMWVLYRRVAPRVSAATRWVLIGLRAAFLAVLFLILAIPAIQTPRSRSGDVFTAVLLDTSKSMSIPDVQMGGKSRPRIEVAKEALFGPLDSKGVRYGGGLNAKLSKSSRVTLYGFDQDAVRSNDPAGLDARKANGQATNIFRAVYDVDSDLRGVPLSGVVMVTDGCRNTGGSIDEAAKILRSRNVPLHIIGLGNPRPPKDYEVMRVFAPRRVRRNSQVEIYATVRYTDFKEPFRVQVLRGNTELVSKTVQPAEQNDVQRVRLAFTPDHEGTATYKVAIPPAEGEAITTNNSQDFTLEIQDDRLPVLYIEGSPRIEYRFLRRAMFRDRDFRVVGMLRLAKGRFYVQGANEAEKYLDKDFPDTPEKLFAFQAVILGDIEASYFTPRQLQLLEEFVNVRGGGLLMLGGVNSFGLGKYAGTPVGKMLPLDISPVDPPYSDERYRARITADGLKHPVMRIGGDVEASRHLWDNAPQLIGITPVKGVKPGGQLLLASEKGQPVLAVQNYGAGRVAAFTSGGSWYYQMSVPASEQFHEKFWKQLIRWLVVGAREQLTAETDADVYARKDPVLLKAAVYGKDLKPLNDATVVATITDPLGNKQDMPMDWVLSEEGAYQCRYLPDEEGNYSVSVRVEGWTSKPVLTEFRVSEPMIEFNDAGLKEDALKGMARATGGRYYNLGEIDKLPAEIEKSAMAARTQGIAPKKTPIWDTPILFAALLVLCSLEWIIRRRSGLA
ncbi:MAG: glutamine amidotransferase [Phycisphaerae bacterium]